MVSRYPPPLGGVTVFAQRKHAELIRQGNKVKLVDLGKCAWTLKFIYFILTQRKAHFMINSLALPLLAFCWITGILSKCSVYDHNASRHYLRSPIRLKWLLFFSKSAGQMIVVHKRLQDFYKFYGVATKIESPFLPPDPSRHEDVISSYPESLLDFIDSSDQIVLLNSAWRYVVDSSGNDLYGVKCTLELLRRLIEIGISVRLVFAFADFNIEAMPHDLIDDINTLQSDGSLYVTNGQLELWPLFSKVDLFLRTTATDGESVSVLEAIYFGCPVVASNVVPRPPGVNVYKYNNKTDFFDVVIKTLPSVMLTPKQRDS